MRPDHPPLGSSSKPRPSIRHVLLLVIVAIFVMGILTVTEISRMSNASNPHHELLPKTIYLIGTASRHEPSGYGPPMATALKGFKLTYVNDFVKTGIPKGWFLFHGVPGGAPGGQFSPRHVTVRGGRLLLNTYRDRHFHNRWVTGGLCQCGRPYLYGAFFVRSRFNGLGPNEVELLWPANNQWPPEIDFNETTSTNGSTSTVHWGYANYIQQIGKHGVNMLAWHTWGIIWTSNKIEYVLDGHVWGSITNAQEIPRIPMRLDLEQRTECLIHVQCPKVPVQMQVDWVAEYRTN